MIRIRMRHLNIAVADLDDMTTACHRVKELGFRVALGSGQHTNDKELSCYAVTPAGFEWEIGRNPILVDEKTWEPTTYQGISIWGHTPGKADERACLYSDMPSQVYNCARSRRD